MMPVVRIPEPVFERLQAIATPLVDTPASVIEKLLDFYDGKVGTNRPRELKATPPTLHGPTSKQPFNLDSPPDLSHTRVLSAEFDGHRASNWNDLVFLAHRQAMSHLKSFEALRSATLSNVTNTRKVTSGFHFLSDLSLSIQNVDANLAWRNALHLARRLKVPVKVEFEWRQKSRAAHPGKSGSLSWSPTEG